VEAGEVVSVVEREGYGSGVEEWVGYEVSVGFEGVSRLDDVACGGRFG
jgi:hypothetical protein